MCFDVIYCLELSNIKISAVRILGIYFQYHMSDSTMYLHNNN